MMLEKFYDVAIIGAGPGGLAAAVAAKQQGAEKVIVVERDKAPGGILRQCIHAGFGLTYFKEELTGPEYAGRLIKQAVEAGVDFLFDSMVLSLPEDGGLICSNPEEGLVRVNAKATILAMGCRERTRFNLRIPGTRPAGVYTAGTAQRLMNRQNEMVGKKVVILGSGDIGMIMARRMTLEGAKVEAVVEIMDFLAGLTRNKVQCLDDFGIDLLLRHTVTRICGERRLEGVWIAQVDENLHPILSTEKYIPCDTLLISCGLIPENELTRAANIKVSPITNGPEVDQFHQTMRPGTFACGNVLHVCDLADNVSAESKQCGIAAAKYAAGELPEAKSVADTVPGNNVRYVCPQRVVVTEEPGMATLNFRVSHPGGKTRLIARCGDEVLAQKTVLRVNPGEMNFLEVASDKIAGKEIRVDAEEM